MTVRVFSASRITLDEGTLDTFRTNGILNGAFSVVVTFKRSGSTTDGAQYLVTFCAGGGVRGAVLYSTTSVMEVEVGGVGRTFTGLTLTNDVWYTAVVRKAAGTATPQCRLFNHAAGTWSAWTNASGTLNNDTTAIDQIQLGNRPSDFPLNGKMAGAAVYDYSVLDGVAQSFRTGFGYWKAGFPVAMWLLTQASAATPVVDLIGDADETAITGTSVDGADDPASFNQVVPSLVLLDYAQSTWAGVGTPEVTDDLNWNATGDRVVALGGTETNSSTLGVPSMTGMTLAAMTGTPTNTTDSCKGYAWEGTAAGDGNSQLTSTPNSNAAQGISAWALSNVNSIPNPQVLVNAALTVNVAIAENNSSVFMFLGDWNASADVDVDTVPAGGIIRQIVSIGGAACFAIGEWHGQASGSRAYGLANWTGTGTITKVAVQASGVESGATEVSSDLDVRWSVENLVNSDLDVRWSVANLVDSDLDVRWNVSNLVNSDLDVRWSVENLVNSDLDVRWSVANLVDSDLDVRWSVAGSTTEVTSDLDVRWSVANEVSSDLDVRWSVSNSVNSDLDVRWSVANLVTSDLDVRWSVAGDAPANVESWGLQV